MLGPLLFPIYIDNVTRTPLSEGTKLMLYADDMLLYRKIDGPEDYTALQSDINAVSNWVKDNYLTFNTAKCKYMLISRRQQGYCDRPNLLLDDLHLERVESFKYLGIILSSDLSWSCHVESICARARKVLGLLYRRFYTNAEPPALLQLYLSLVRPHLEYASDVWDPNLQKDIEKTRTTAYHPKSDGLVERLNCTVLIMLSLRIEEDEEGWDEHLQEVMMAYRASVQGTTKFIPFRSTFGREVQLPIGVMFGRTPGPAVEVSEYATNLRCHLEKAAREHTKSAQKRQKDNYDRRAPGGRFQVGDNIWLHSPFVPRGRSQKLHRYKVWLHSPFVPRGRSQKLHRYKVWLHTPFVPRGRSQKLHRYKVWLHTPFVPRGRS